MSYPRLGKGVMRPGGPTEAALSSNSAASNCNTRISNYYSDLSAFKYHKAAWKETARKQLFDDSFKHYESAKKYKEKIENDAPTLWSKCKFRVEKIHLPSQWSIV